MSLAATEVAPVPSDVRVPATLLNMVILNVPEVAQAMPPEQYQLEEPIKILYHGLYSKGRGIESVIQAMAMVQSSVVFGLRGYGDNENALRKLVDDLQVQEKVQFLEPVKMTELVNKAAEFHVGVIPFEKSSSFAESLPNKVFEYMASGLCILSNNLVELERLITSHHIGKIYYDENPKSIASAIDELCSDINFLQVLRGNAWTVFNEVYAWGKHKHVLLTAYERLGNANKGSFNV